jgi:hypothetical protein
VTLEAVPDEEPWFRVHFRKSMIVVKGVAELERIKARKVPKVVLVEPAQIHECSVCHKREAWGKTWCWYGSWKAIDDGKPVRKFCSPECRRRWRAKPPKKAGHGQGGWEPERRGADSWRKVHDARAAANPRRFPWPEWPKERQGRGWCRWCGEEIINRSGKRKGKRSHVREWHRISYGDDRDCRHEADLHVNLEVQYWHIVQRDGIGCGICGKGEGRWVKGAYGFHYPERETGCSWIRWSVELEVDHILPLWMSLGLPDEERRAFFGPDNLWLLCKLHHRWKSAREAAERAAARSRGS